MSIIEIRHFHLFAGLGGGARGFNRGKANVGNLEASFRCIGGVDIDPMAMRDFKQLAGVQGTVIDMFDREQYKAFHGAMPPPDWREATPQDIQRAAGGERPHICFLSAPCKGFSGLLSETKSKTAKYQALNRLTLRGVWLMLEAWADDPPELVLFENVPRLATRGRALLDQITAMLRSYGYATAETTHDCGELGGLAQSRKRFLLVARHLAKVPPLLYQPERRPLRAVGDVLDRMLLPGDLRAGPMHRIPSLNFKTWVRLAFVEAGSDWRSLNKLAVQDGHLRDFLIVPTMHRGTMGVKTWGAAAGTITGNARAITGAFSVADPRAEVFASGYGVNQWSAPTGAVAGESLPSNGRFAVADPRFVSSIKWHDGQAYGVHKWADSTGAIAGQQNPGQGFYSVADPRCANVKHNNCFKVVRFDQASGTVTTGKGPSAGGMGVADPRPAPGPVHAKYSVASYESATRTVIAGSTTGQGAYAVADPRPGMRREPGDDYLTAGHYGVVPWSGSSGAVSAAACHDNGRWSVADPRALHIEEQSQRLPSATDKLVCRIEAMDGTWHRPFTTLELAALQSLYVPEEHWSPDPRLQSEIDEMRASQLGLRLAGESDSAWRERIGNAVPPDAAEAIASEMGRTLLLAWSGETFQLSATPIWVRPTSLAISVAQGDAAPL